MLKKHLLIAGVAVAVLLGSAASSASSLQNARSEFLVICSEYDGKLRVYCAEAQALGYSYIGSYLQKMGGDQTLFSIYQECSKKYLKEDILDKKDYSMMKQCLSFNKIKAKNEVKMP